MVLSRSPELDFGHRRIARFGVKEDITENDYAGTVLLTRWVDLHKGENHHKPTVPDSNIRLNFCARCLSAAMISSVPLFSSLLR